jgi:ketosteroid isomerase-like protein
MGQTAAVPRTILQAMQETNRLFSEQVVRNKQIAKLDSVYTEDAIILPPDSQIIRGRENIKQFWSKVILEAGLGDAPLITVEAEMLGDAAYEIGTAQLTFVGQSGTSQISVKYVVIWKQEANGSWKWHRDIWNPTPR